MNSSCLESYVEEDFKAAIFTESAMSVEVSGWALGLWEREMGSGEWETDASSCHSWLDFGHVSRLSEEIVPYQWWKLCTAGP